MKGKTPFILIFILQFLFLIYNADAQLDISGRVIDADTKEVLVGVNIAIGNTEIGTTTDNSGFFRMFEKVDLPCTLELTMKEYVPRKITIEKNESGLELQLKKVFVPKENIEKIDEPEVDEKVKREKSSNISINVSGRVYDKETEQPLMGVNIIVKNTVIGTATDNSGFFRLTGNEKLPCVLRISMIGYKTQEIEITKNHKDLKFYLSNETVVSGEVIVKAKEIEVEQKNFRQVISIETMDALTIRETPSANFYQALGHLKGVDVVMQSMNFMTVNARGFNSTENTRFVQIVDGMDNMAPGMNFPIGNIAGLSELDVESVEFIPGPGEVQYGGNALNGILMMKGKDPFKYQGVSLYVKPGVSDIVPGSDHPFQFSGKPQLETGIRIAKAFKDKFAFKINATYSRGLDWYADDMTNIRPGNIKWELDPGYDAINKYGDEVTSDLPIGKGGSNVIVSRTGYRDKNLINNDLENLKLNGALHYRLTNKVTAILHGNYGEATTAYTGDNRTSLSGFSIYQGKAELQGEHFMFRGYGSFQNSGHSYDAKFLAVHLNNLASSDEDWFHNFYYAYIGGFRTFGVRSHDYNEARAFADKGRLLPGTPEFDEAKNKIINNPDFRKGAGIHNNSAMYNVDAKIDLNKYTKKTKVTLGGNYRFFDLDSQGSIFPDTLGNDITFYEVGAFADIKRNFIDERLVLNASARFDKSENFTGHFSPRVSALYSIDNNNNIRFSVLTGFRNPGVKEQFINKDLGTARYLGGLEGIFEPYNIPLNSIYLDNVNAFNNAVSADVINPDNPYGLNQAIQKNLVLLEEGIVQPGQIQQLKPEQVISFEVGYKTSIKKVLYLDAVYYNSVYRDFIGITKLVKPRTSPQIDMFMAATQVNKSAQNDVYFMNVNSHELVGIQGASLGYKWLMPMGSIISGNITWSDIRSDVNDPVAPGFNTPGFKYNLSLQNRKMDRMENNPGFRNIGFKITWRYQNRYYWESTFGDGWVEPVSTLDVQFTLNIDKPKSMVKFGASNFFNNSYSYSFGGPNIGVFYYVSYLIDNVF
jgi:iron complex outermembrane recepter protein